MKFSDLKTVDEVMSRTFISAIGTKSVSVTPMEKYRDSDGNRDAQGFEILWENGNKSWVTYWEGDRITVDKTPSPK